MQLIRYTYARDVAEFGDQPVLVEDLEAKVLVDQLQRAERVSADDLEALKKDDLLRVADEADVEVKKSAPKKQIAQAVAESGKP